MEVPNSIIEKIISVDDEIILASPTLDLADYFFNSLQVNKKHLANSMPWLSKMETIKDAENFLRELSLFNVGGQKFNAVIFFNSCLAGIIAYNKIDKKNRRAEIGYWTFKEYQGNGLISRSISPFLKFGFSRLNINRVDLFVEEDNNKSIKIASKAGFVKEGLLKEFLIENGNPKDVLYYRILASEFKTKSIL